MLTVPATITFNKRMTFDQLKAFLENYEIEGEGVEARALMEDGTRVTLFSILEEGVDGAERNIIKMVQENGCQEYLGVIGMQGYVLSDQIDNIQSCEDVYLIDTSNGNLMEVETTTETVQSTVESEKVVFPKSLAWELEDLNKLN